MLVDWITARLGYTHFHPDTWSGLRLLNDRVQRFCPRTGTVRWESSAWDSVRSDSHQIACRVGSDAFWLQGSPARVCGSGDAVFGEGASSALDLKACLLEMIKFASNQLGVDIPIKPELWIITRVDITQNIMLDSLGDVLRSLGYLRSCEGGRYKVTAQSGDTVYWSNRSKLRKGKAYAKGPHIKYMMNQKGYTGYNYSQQQQKASDRLLRLEETLGCKFFDRKSKKGIQWHDITPEMLNEEWQSYFERMIGDIGMTKEADIPTRLQAVAPTPGQARSAYGCWLLIKHEGWHQARKSYPSRTWYRHMNILRAAGLGDMDISTGNVVPLRLKILEAQKVNTWDDLLYAA